MMFVQIMNCCLIITYYIARMAGAPSFGESGGYQSTIKMNFRGQDKKRPDPAVLGMNPNASVEDEYIQNLQQ